MYLSDLLAFVYLLVHLSQVYSVANMDVMGLMAAFEDMGFRFKSDSVIDPELYMDALRIGFFRDTGSEANQEQESASNIAKDSGVTKKTVMESKIREFNLFREDDLLFLYY